MCGCADDQAESGLIRLLRASGIEGLQGMAPSRPFLSAAFGMSLVSIRKPIAAVRKRKVSTASLVCLLLCSRFPWLSLIQMSKELKRNVGKSSGRIVRPLLGMSKDELVAFCHSQGHTFAVDPTNSDTFFARNHLRSLMGNQQPIAACTPREVASHSPSQAAPTELACEETAVSCKQSDLSTDHRETSCKGMKLETGQQSPGRGLTADTLRVMAACIAASQKLQRDADLLLQQARLPGPSMLLKIEGLRESSKHVAIRALSKAIVVRGPSTLMFPVELHLSALCHSCTECACEPYMPYCCALLAAHAIDAAAGDQPPRRGCSGSLREGPQGSRATLDSSAARKGATRFQAG